MSRVSKSLMFAAGLSMLALASEEIVAAKDCPFAVAGLIFERWQSLGGSDGPLGCPIADETNAEGPGLYQQFEYGAITWSPNTGPSSVQAVYRIGRQLWFEWGNTAVNYDKFIVRIDKDGQNILQDDVFVEPDQLSPGVNYEQIGSISICRFNTSGGYHYGGLVPGRYRLIVEGCCGGNWSNPVYVDLPIPPPMYTRRQPAPQAASNYDNSPTMFDNGSGGNGAHRPAIDLQHVHLPPYLTNTTGAVLNDARPMANATFGARAAAVVRATAGDTDSLLREMDYPALAAPFGSDLTAYFVDALELLGLPFSPTDPFVWPQSPSTFTLNGDLCMALMAYADYFPESDPSGSLRSMVSRTIPYASPGWCGTFGPGVDSTLSVIASTVVPREGNYDMSQMHLLRLAYAYYNELDPDAREWLIRQLLGEGQIQRPNETEAFTHTSGGVPNDWNRAGHISPLSDEIDLPETENHVLMIATARYLSNQLLYQRDLDVTHNNRKNGDHPDRKDCTEQILLLLRHMLMDDFVEYNAKSYSEETRWALLNLHDFAYDQEVRLAARLVLDYLSARMAVSSDDCRRLVPFRRRNEGANVGIAANGMDVGLLPEWVNSGADPMGSYFAFLSGNTRGYEMADLRKWPKDELAARANAWTMQSSPELIIEALSDYRLPPSVHDLFVNDLHRRFFQRLHRTTQSNGEFVQDPRLGCDNREIYAGSPSYLITAGGRAADHAYAGWEHFGWRIQGWVDENLGVSVPTTFIPTGLSAGVGISETTNLIQFAGLSTQYSAGHVLFENYGVAPDFACGTAMTFPEWIWKGAEDVYPPGYARPFTFVDRGSFVDDGSGGRTRRVVNGRPEFAGFYLAIFMTDDGVLLEAFDTWLHPEVTYQQFKTRVLAANPAPEIVANQECRYRTQNGNLIRFIVWENGEQDQATFGAKITGIDYGPGDPMATLAGAGNDQDSFLTGSILKGQGDGLVEIRNPFLGTTLTLDMRDMWHPQRISETGEIEQAGYDNEVWVNFDWTGPTEGDFFHPYNALAAALAVVADGGVIKIMPGTTRETPTITKQVRLVAPAGGVIIGVR